MYKRSISFTKLASRVQNWRFVYKYAVFNLQTSISDYKLASRITTQRFHTKYIHYYAHCQHFAKQCFAIKAAKKPPGSRAVILMEMEEFEQRSPPPKNGLDTQFHSESF